MNVTSIIFSQASDSDFLFVLSILSNLSYINNMRLSFPLFKNFSFEPRKVRSWHLRHHSKHQNWLIERIGNELNITYRSTYNTATFVGWKR